ISLDPGEVVTCVFTNTQQGRIVVEKQTVPDGSAQLFEFDPSYSATNFFLADGQQNNSGFLAPGNYSVAEVNLPAGWAQSSAVCCDGSPANAISLQPGEVVTCVFTNTLQLGTITVVKDTVPNALQDFTFTRSFGPNFQLDDDAGVPGGDNTLLNSISFANLTPGTYTVTENAQVGYKLSNLVINDPDGGSSIDLVNRTATIDLDPGETITATFVNTLNTIVITPDKGNRSLPYVHIVDATTGELVRRFKAYDQN